MYTPTHFKEEDTETLCAFMREHPFATLVSNDSEGPTASHIPVEVKQDPDGAGIRILGHLARANPHWRSFGSDEGSLLIFHGPHEYISPDWYESKNLVPTWNYAAVHAYGRIRVVEGAADVRVILDELVDRFESKRATPWVNQLDEDFMQKLQAAIVAFELEVERLEGKFKLSQNRLMLDQQAALTRLESETTNVELARLTRQRLKAEEP